MARPIRLEFGGAYYHVTARGDRREAIYEDDADREQFLDVLTGMGRRLPAATPISLPVSDHLLWAASQPPFG